MINKEQQMMMNMMMQMQGLESGSHYLLRM